MVPRRATTACVASAAFVLIAAASVEEYDGGNVDSCFTDMYGDGSSCALNTNMGMLMLQTRLVHFPNPNSTVEHGTLAKPVFDGTVAANCPPCKDFGSTVLKQLYAADGIAEAVEFKFHSAIRSPEAPAKGSWSCPDEDVDCPMTKWFICAVDGWNTTTTTQDQRINFLTCWDSQPDTTSSEQKARKCAKAAGLQNWDSISSCATGDKAEALELAAASAFEKRFPSHAHSGIFGVPHLFIDGKDLGEDRDFKTVLKMLCGKGIKAGACNEFW